MFPDLKMNLSPPFNGKLYFGEHNLDTKDMHCSCVIITNRLFLVSELGNKTFILISFQFRLNITGEITKGQTDKLISQESKILPKVQLD